MRNIPRPNLFERTAAKVFPSYAARVYKTRAAMELAYTGADKKRRTMANWRTDSGDFNTDVLPELEDLRNNSEHLYRNNMIAAGAINTKVTSIVGRGLTAHPRIDAQFLGLSEDVADAWEAKAARGWAIWSESKLCTVNKKHNFRELQSVAFLSSLVRGDAFVITPEKKPSAMYPYKLRTQLIEADRVINEDRAVDTDRIAGGVEVDADGAAYRLHVLKGHPGNFNTEQNEWEKIRFFGEKTGRRNVLHIYSSIRADQSRGVPDLAPIIEGLKQFGTLTQATVDAAVIQTFLSVFIETPESNSLNLDPGSTDTDQAGSVKLESAAIIDLAPGEKATVVNPTHPNANYAGFANEFYTQLGAALQIPKELLIKYFGASYSASQAALLEAWRYFMKKRSDLIDNLCQPVYELWLSEEISSGRLSAPGFFTDPVIRAAYCGADWVGSPRGHIRDDVQNKADGYAEDRGWKTAAQNTQERGGVWERNHRQRAKEIKARKADGLITNEEQKGASDVIA